MQRRPGDLIDRAERAARTEELFARLDAGGVGRDAVLAEIVALYDDVVQSIARRYGDRGVDLEELRQVGYVGLMKAINGYRPDRGELLAYAVTTIVGETRRHFRDRCWAIRPPRRLQELAMRVAALRPRLQQELGREPTAAELAERLEEDRDDVRAADGSHALFHLISTDTPLCGAGTLTLGETVGDGDRLLDRAEAAAAVRAAIARCGLCERDRRVLAMRFFEDMTQSEIAAEIGVTQMQVSRILSAALAALREHIGALD